MARRTQPTPLDEMPEGFRYAAEFLSTEEESALLKEIEGLQFRAFDFHGYIAKRRIVAYGWDYDFRNRTASEAAPVPEFLKPLRERAAAFAGVEPETLVEAVVTEYTPGAPIGWHRDVPQFETVTGISLASACKMRFKPYRSEGEILWMALEPRSIYVLGGSARWKWQHSIPAVERLRYSVTFRTLRKGGRMGVTSE